MLKGAIVLEGIAVDLNWMEKKGILPKMIVNIRSTTNATLIIDYISCNTTHCKHDKHASSDVLWKFADILHGEIWDFTLSYFTLKIAL